MPDAWLPGLVADQDRFADALADALLAKSDAVRTGKVLEVIGTVVKVGGLDVSLGDLCELRAANGALLQYAEVIGFTRSVALLSPFARLDQVSRATRVVALGRPLSVPAGRVLLGRVVNSFGQPIDGGSPIPANESTSIFAEPPAPMQRRMIAAPLATGVRAVDGMLTLAEGQRMGIFAPAGVGKSTLLGMFARGAQCDVNVIALIGERGREVREFVETILGPEGMARSVVVCATSDRSAIERAKAAYVATAIAESFRNEGQRVLLMMDSLTRFARALREVGLAAGESPVRRGFPPSVFAKMPYLLERAGMGARGSITALYTVLEEDDSGGDPISEEVRGIVDGHMVLSREIAAKHQYPAIDMLRSLSRVMPQVVPPDHVEDAGRVRRLLAQYGEIEALLQIGEYQSGSNPVADEAIAKIDAIRAFLSQPRGGHENFDETRDALRRLAESGV
ncbi:MULTISPECIES: FliI/YscN family ATPase [Burkholderia]|uniref:Type III secretion protein N (ATPase) n=1 Tax=Burkholderia pyrrocinia TaxID=60550 RepID=A0A318HU25_BURPY|nr:MULTISPECIES: FliI/YscN family ATPase [Burkholderia]PXX21938.1 type III secretion protein N (ATPase) [Burkholderia pyrrocinia]SFW89889.1 ATP synthase in type III secretion protein N [Burkholderia sp. NFACC33-1]SFY46353.1 ATP synthase in type III secretion protein N [Burkholderia sp. NFPP32]